MLYELTDQSETLIESQQQQQQQPFYSHDTGQPTLASTSS